MIQAIFFDLDSCLAAADEVGEQLYQPAFDVIRAASHGAVSEEALRAAFSDCWRCAFDFVADKHGFTDEMRSAGWAALSRVEVTRPMHGYPDLAILKELPARLHLVTSGFRRLQESKIRALGFAAWFESIHIDAIDEPNRRGKAGIFAAILADQRLKPAEVLVVGDNPDSEIEAGNRLGMPTIQILRPGVPRSAAAAGHIRSLVELKDLLRRAVF